MFIVPIILLAALLVVVVGANSMKKKGTLTESGYQTLISVTSIIVTIAALVVMFVRMRGK
jgi:membrane-associated PAP2 superfamily phosphatase